MRIQIRAERFPVLSETFVVNEARALARLGHDVEVLAHERGDTQVAGVPARYRSDSSRAARWRAAAALTARRPRRAAADVLARRRWAAEEHVAPLRLAADTLLAGRGRHVHVHFAAGAALDALRGLHALGTPYSLTAHAYDIYARPANLAEKLRQATLVTTGCEYTARRLREIEPRARVEVVVMGVDPEEFRRSSPPAEGRIVLAVGRLVEKKGFAHLIDAIRTVPDAELRIAGHGPLRADLERRAQGLPVTFLGALPPAAVRDELERAAVVAVPSVVAADGDRDSMPVVAKEALAMEVPVVASDEVGLPELIRPAFGRLVPPADAAALAAALTELLDLPAAERARMGAAGRSHVAEHANVEIETARLATLLQALR